MNSQENSQENFQVSQEFYIKATNSGLTDESNDFNWIWQDIQNGKSLCEICSRFIEFTEWDGDCYTDTSSAILDAFVSFKNKQKIPIEDKKYLRNRSGVITTKCVDEDDNSEPIYYHFTCHDLILELDGSEFFDWLNGKK